MANDRAAQPRRLSLIHISIEAKEHVKAVPVMPLIFLYMRK